MKSFFLILVLIFSGLLTSTPKARAATAGDLVRIKDSPAVYYLGAGGKRYAFPNEKIFRSWYNDFSLVKEISALELTQYTLAGNVTYRPGSRLIKITTDPKVYAVEPGGKLRHIATESLAIDLFGNDWNKKIDDLPDAFFASGYVIGRQISTLEHPVGSLIQFIGQSAKYLVAAENDRIVKRLVSDTAFTSNRLGTLFLLQIDSTKFSYPDGSSLAESDAAQLDVSQMTKAVAAPPLTGEDAIKIAVNKPAAVLLRGAPLTTIGSFTVAGSPFKDITVTRIKFTGYIDANEGDPDFQPGRDVDLSGSFFSDINQIITDIGLYNSQGQLLAGPKQISSNGDLEYLLSLNIKAQGSETLLIKAQIPTNFPLLGRDDRISFDLVNKTDLIAADLQGLPVPLLTASPNGASSPLNFTYVKRTGSLKIENDPTLPGERFAALGQTNQKISGLLITALDEPFIIKQLTIKNRFDSNRSLNAVRLLPAGQSAPAGESSAPTTFRDLKILVNPDQPLTLQIMVDIKEENQGAISGDKVALDFDITDFQAEAQVSKEILIKDNVDINLFNKTTNTSAMILRKSYISFSLAVDSPAGPATRGLRNIIKYKISNPTKKVAYLNEMTFKIITNDIGAEGTDNDLLERLAGLDGDAADDDHIADLFAGQDLNTPLAEGSLGRLVYSVWDQSEKVFDTTPLGLQSALGDFGLLQYVFGRNGLEILPESETTYSLYLETGGLAPGEFRVFMEILADTTQDLSTNNLEWSDGTTISSGYLIQQLPLQSHVLEFR